MSLIIYKQVWTLTQANVYDPDAQLYYDLYNAELWRFNTDALAAEHLPYPDGGTWQYFAGYNDPPEDSNLLGEIHHVCLTSDGFRRGWVHDGSGTLTVEDDEESAACGWVPPTDPEEPEEPEEPTDPDDPAPVDPEPAVRIEVATAPPALAVAGLPILVTLRSVPTGRTAAAAVLDLQAGGVDVAATTRVVVNGETFVGSFNPATAAEFADLDQLAQCLAGSAVLSARYRVTMPAPTHVRLTARQPGRAFNVAASSNDASVVVTRTSGVDALRSQTKAGWGCYAEVWQVPGAVFGGAFELGAAELVTRLEQDYQAGNAYTFDLAPALRELLNHSRSTTIDRMVAYFVRYGETFQPAGSQIRRRFVQADTAVCWALEGTVAVPPLATALSLSVPPPRWVLPKAPAYAERLTLLAPAGAAVQLQLVARYFDASTATQTATLVATGGVQAWPIGALLLASAAGAKGWPLYATVRATVAGDLVAEHRVLLVPAGPADRCLVFCSPRGAYEAFWVRGLPDPTTKRTAQLYARGREQAVRSVELSTSTKLQSARLDAATLAWADGLAAAPRVYLFDPAAGSYADVVATAYTPSAKPEEHDYSFTLDVEPAAPTPVLTA